MVYEYNTYYRLQWQMHQPKGRKKGLRSKNGLDQYELI
jgi:hypothetical protein